MNIQRHEIEAWLGHVLAELTNEQVDQIHRHAVDLEAAYPGTEHLERRDALLVAFLEGLTPLP